MARIVLKTEISAPIERCFDLSRSIDLHQISTAKTFEKAIAGRISGLINLHETVTWKARHFGLWFTLTSKITALESPTYFIDEMVKGPFQYMHHRHEFYWNGSVTIMIDTFNFRSPYGLLGKIVDILILKAYLTRFLLERNAVIKQYAEGEAWKTVIHNH